MRQLIPLVLLTVLSNNVHAEDIPLKDGTVLQNAKIVGVSEGGVLIIHKGGLQQYDHKLVPENLISGAEVKPATEEKPTPNQQDSDMVEIYAVPDSRESGVISKHLGYRELETIDGWRKIELQVWIKDSNAVERQHPPKATIATLPPEPEDLKEIPKRQFKEYDIDDLSVVVTAGSLRGIQIKWSAKYIYETRSSRVIGLQAQFLDEHYVPLITSNVQTLYLSGGETVSGIVTTTRERLDLCKYVRFFFGSDREPTDFFEFRPE